MSKSLRGQLLTWVLAPLMLAVAVDAWLSYRNADNTASVVQDRLLLGSARMIAEQISFEDGAFQHQVPPAALELFQSEQSDRIFYRVTTGNGQLLSGYTELPLPSKDLKADLPQFFAATMRGELVRTVAIFQPVVGNPSVLPVVVEVAQTMRAHKQLASSLWMHTVEQQLFILALATILILFGLHRGLQPLIRLRNEVQSRQEGSLQPLQTGNIPAELTPLVESLNDYIQRLEGYTNRRNSFIQNAAHQLRTPLTVLQTQISDALRADIKEDSDAAIKAARKTLQQTVRLVNQFLSLSSAEVAVEEKVILSTREFCAVIQKVLEDLAVQAHAKNIDLGFERSGPEAFVAADPSALREIAINIIDNAIMYTQVTGIVTVRVRSEEGCISLEVEDNGPGIATGYQEKVFERFFRIKDASTSGSGLGLAIVKELAFQCGATIFSGTPRHGGRGLLMTVAFVAP
jgi:two-component system, OmpR family, sensor histidine kinase TctE